MNLNTLHPKVSDWRIGLLNEAGDRIYLERFWEYDDFRLRIGTVIDGDYIKPDAVSEPVKIVGHRMTVWSFDFREDVEEFIRMLERVKNEIPKRPKGEMK